MTLNRVELLFNALSADEILLAKLLKFRGSRGKKYTLIVEGHDDVTFIDAALSKHNRSARPISAIYNCQGKQNALVLHRLICESRELPTDLFRIFIDHDFDGLRGDRQSDILWMTPSYSFENLLVSEVVLEAILAGEFRCNDADADQDIENITGLFKNQFLSSFVIQLRFANLCAFAAKLNNIETRPHEETVTQYIGVKFPAVEFPVDDNALLASMGKNGPLPNAALVAAQPDFDTLDPLKDWRGKFIFAAFLIFLDEARKDRGKKVPKHFTKRARMTFNPKNDSVRSLTSVAELPASLVTFVQALT